MPDTFQNRINSYTDRVEQKLDEALPLASTQPTRLHEAMRYSVQGGGKRIRPLLAYATGECLGLDKSLLDAPAVAIELIHAFSLVHDDLPAMDNDDLRRGRATVHKAYDEATAILAADALQPLAYSVLSQLDGVSAEARNKVIKLIADASGSTGMTGGQAIDLSSEGCALTAPELEHMYALKTGALIRASVVSASLLREDLSEGDAEALDAFSGAIGIAFQIKDDILDVEGETDVIGKPAGSDVAANKATYPALMGVDASRKRCDELSQGALAQLERFGSRAAPLDWLARYIVERGH